MGTPSHLDETQTSDGATGAAGDGATCLALVVALGPGDPGRIGEACIVPPLRPETSFILGRGPTTADDPHARLEFVRSRPGIFETRPPLASPRLSRVQLVIAADGARALSVRNLGRCPLWCNGVRVESAQVTPGDTLQIGNELLLLCVRRELVPVSIRTYPSPPVFGEIDAHGLVGESPVAWELRRRIAFFADHPEHVLVLGESGTGKEIVARALHALSPRAGGPFVTRNAATLPESLIDAELFGHARNYPNPGMPERRGIIGEAAGGTLFLDELAELPPAMQTHLLRVLDGGEYQRLGEGAPRISNFRLVGATNRPAQLRDDLAARLKLRLRVPNLEERLEDIPLLTVHLLRTIGRSSEELAVRVFERGDLACEPRIAFGFMDSLLRHRYTTHVRELEAMLWEALADSSANRLDRSRRSRTDAPPRALDALAARPRSEPPSSEVIAAALAQHGGSLDRTWRTLGLSSRHALRRLMDKYGLRRQKM